MPRSKLKNTPQANYCYRQARQAINRLDGSQNKKATVAAICRHLRMAIAADGDQ
jgi:hypothetical protein